MTSQQTALKWLFPSPHPEILSLSYTTFDLLVRILAPLLTSTSPPSTSPPSFTMISIPPSSPYFPIAVMTNRHLQDCYFRSNPDPINPSLCKFVACPFDCVTEPIKRVNDALNTLLLEESSCVLILVDNPTSKSAVSDKLVDGAFDKVQRVVIVDVSALLCLDGYIGDDLSPSSSTNKRKADEKLFPYSFPFTSFTSSNSSTSTSTHLQIPSHLVFTSGTTGKPKGCICSRQSLSNYCTAKTKAHEIFSLAAPDTVLLASSLSFDPCISDVICTLTTPPNEYSGFRPCLALASSAMLSSDIRLVISLLNVTHVLTTPSLWGLAEGDPRDRSYQTLKVLALGGEMIPSRILEKWASENNGDGDETSNSSSCSGSRLKVCCTYGVTEACVYQSFGEVFKSIPHPRHSNSSSSSGSGSSSGASIGFPLQGNTFQICSPDSLESLDYNVVGEIVISGSQLDVISDYYGCNSSDLLSLSPSSSLPPKFTTINKTKRYRTGDRGYMSREHELFIIGRIPGEEGMIKLNGIRVELGEIEGGICDSNSHSGGSGGNGGSGTSVVNHCLCKYYEDDVDSADGDETSNKYVVAYILLSPSCRTQMNLPIFTSSSSSSSSPSSKQKQRQMVCPNSPLLTLLRARCDHRVKPGCFPSHFVICAESELPLGATGKADKRGVVLEKLEECKFVFHLSNLDLVYDSNSNNNDGGGGMGMGMRMLKDISKVGELIANTIIDTLNLQPCQQSYLTVDADFLSVGGDSLSATRVVRKVWADHHGRRDGRCIGGTFGDFSGFFSPTHLMNGSKTLGEYVKFLETNGICASEGEESNTQSDSNSIKIASDNNTDNVNDSDQKPVKTDGIEIEESPTLTLTLTPSESNESALYDALIEACTLGWSNVVKGLIAVGANPNLKAHGGRLGKKTGRNERKSKWTASPIHLACLRGDPIMVEALLAAGCKANAPDATGAFPLHLACAGQGKGKSDTSVGIVDADASSSSRVTKTAPEPEPEPTTETENTNLATKNRIEVVRLLLSIGNVKITSKDGNKQCLLHAASRSGNVHLLTYVIDRWEDAYKLGMFKVEGSSTGKGVLDWRDRWYRSPVHWAVLNGHVEAVKVLLERGASREPWRKGTVNKSSNMTIESPLEMAVRIYGGEGGEYGVLLRK